MDGVIQDTRTRIRLLLQKLDSAESTLSRATAAKAAEEREIELMRSTIELYRICGSQRAEAIEKIEQLATLFLQAMFDDTYEFKFVPVLNDNGVISGYKPMIYESGTPCEPRKNGGGAVNIVSFALRLVAVLRNPQLSPVIWMDEPLANMDIPKWGKFVELLKSLQEHMDFQFGIITHPGAGERFGATYEVRRPNHQSTVARV